MKYFITIFPLLAALSIAAQRPLMFRDLLKTANEISITDSVLIDYSSVEKIHLDENAGEIFYKIIEGKEADSNQNEVYCIAGKITSHKNFDILLLCTQRSTYSRQLGCATDGVPSPTTQAIIRELFFILFDKEGNYVNRFLAALDYRKNDDETNNTRRNSLRKINSWIYPDLIIIQQTTAESWSSNIISLVKTDSKNFNFSMEYHINDYGVFVAYPKYKSN